MNVNIEQKKEQRREYDRVEYLLNKGKHLAQSRNWSEANRERRREIDRKSYFKNREMRLAVDKRNREENPEKAKARDDFRNAVRAGKIEKLPCSICGDSKSHGHHPDYKFPFRVIWLCAKHHNQIHLNGLRNRNS